MKARDIYSIAKGLMFEKQSSTIYDNFVVPNINKILTETFEENNMARMFKGIAPLTEVPLIKTVDDDIPYETEFLNNILPLGLAAYFFIDDDLSKFSIYITDYKNARIINQKMVSQEVIDGFTRNTEL